MPSYEMLHEESKHSNPKKDDNNIKSIQNNENN